MKNKSIAIFLLLLVCSFHGLAQWQKIQERNADYYGQIYTLSPDTVFLAASNGIIYFTYNGGVSMDSVVFNHPGSWFSDIDFPTPQTGYFCGGSAFGTVKSPIVKTPDAGMSWDSLSANQFGYDLMGVSFTDENTGFFIGQGIIVRTTDGGATFEVDSLVPIRSTSDIHFINSHTGFFLAEEYIYRTDDGGNNWDSIYTTGDPTSFSWGRIDFIDANTGFIYSRKDILKTVDGGNTWTMLNDFPDSNFLPMDFDFVTEDIGYAVSLFSIYKTADGGASWNFQYGDSTAYFVSIDMANKDIGYIASFGGLYKTTNGGVDLRETKYASPFLLYPNPAIDQLTLKTADVDIRKIFLTDISGKVIAEIIPQQNQNTVSLAGIESGTYLFSIETDEGIFTEKVVVQKN